jgi:hypothetical protein
MKRTFGITLMAMGVILFVPCVWTEETLGNKGSDMGVKVTNVRDAKFSVSWVTKEALTCQVNYGVDPENLNCVAYDDRGKDVKTHTHHVTITKLLPETTYYFDVVSGDMIDDNGGKHYVVKTGPSIIPVGSDLVFGKVFKSYGSDVAVGSIVYLKVLDQDGLGTKGESQEVSMLVGEGGYWYAELVNLRTSDHKSLFKYSEIGDRVCLSVEGGPDGQAAQIVDTSNDSPAPDMILEVKATE